MLVALYDPFGSDDDFGKPMTGLPVGGQARCLSLVFAVKG
jgi:hypothetical protein